MEYVVLGINNRKQARVLGRITAGNYDDAKLLAEAKWGHVNLNLVVTDEVLHIGKGSLV